MSTPPSRAAARALHALAAHHRRRSASGCCGRWPTASRPTPTAGRAARHRERPADPRGVRRRRPDVRRHLPLLRRGSARDHRGDQIPLEDPGSLAFTLREPLGVIAALIPWNSPMITLANKIGAGPRGRQHARDEAVGVRVGERARVRPRCVEDAPPARRRSTSSPGFGPSVGAALVAHPDSRRSPSPAAPHGRRIMRRRRPGAHAVDLMELGGKSAFVVCADADLDLGGRRRADRHLPRQRRGLRRRVAAARPRGRPRRVRRAVRRRRASASRSATRSTPQTQFGPLVSRHHRDRVRGYIEAARAEGARARRRQRPSSTATLAGGLLPRADAARRSDAARERLGAQEIFGPVDRARALARRGRRGRARQRHRVRAGGRRLDARSGPRAPDRTRARGRASSGSTSGSTSRRAADGRRRATAASAASSAPRRCSSTAPRRRSTSAWARPARASGGDERRWAALDDFTGPMCASSPAAPAGWAATSP